MLQNSCSSTVCRMCVWPHTLWSQWPAVIYLKDLDYVDKGKTPLNTVTSLLQSKHQFINQKWKKKKPRQGGRGILSLDLPCRFWIYNTNCLCFQWKLSKAASNSAQPAWNYNFMVCTRKGEKRETTWGLSCADIKFLQLLWRLQEVWSFHGATKKISWFPRWNLIAGALD